MTKITRFAKVSALMLAVAMFAATGCSAEGGKDANAESNNKKTTKTADASALKVAFVDEDSLMSGYNFAKDVNEALLRADSKLESARRQKENELQRFAGEIERKYKSNGYLTEASFNADQEKLQKMQVDARNYMDNLTRTAQNEALMNSQQLRDSVDKYIAEYSKKQGYTLVLRKAATWYVGNVDDITADVVKGLNERYNKVDKKK